jgi:putative sporulation protein YyaC
MADRNPYLAQRTDAAGLASFMAQVAAAHTLDELTFLCIGTDRSTGDSLGPWVGTILKERGFTRVIGTLREPCDSDRLPQVIPSLAQMGTIVAVDACLGRPEAVGAYLVSTGPLIPARSVGKTFPPIGTYSIAGVVNVSGPKPYWNLQSTSLYRVMGMAAEITNAIVHQWPSR